MELQLDQIIRAPFLPAPAKVKLFEVRAGYYRLEVLVQDGSNHFISLSIVEDQLRQIEILDSNPVALSGNSEDFFFLIESHRIRLAYQFDPQLAVSISQVDPLPHQIEAVYEYALTSPRMRFLIADNPGAGKMIMAGLIFKELQYRRLERRVLINAPGHLKYQWQREMKEKFGTSFAIIDRARLESSWGENVWEERDHCITSIDFVKQGQVRNTFRGTHWDLVIVNVLTCVPYAGMKMVRWPASAISKLEREQNPAKCVLWPTSGRWPGAMVMTTGSVSSPTPALTVRSFSASRPARFWLEEDIFVARFRVPKENRR